jgi:protein tyrosine phosphatase
VSFIFQLDTLARREILIYLVSIDDCNRVVLSSCQDEDYINASYVNIPLPGENKTLRYIATQGPLPHTVEDFWLLVWQEEIRTVAMVTPETERGRVKCHRCDFLFSIIIIITCF